MLVDFQHIPSIVKNFQFSLLLDVGLTNLWITPEPARATQNHPELARATEEPPRASQSQREPMKI